MFHQVITKFQHVIVCFHHVCNHEVSSDNHGTSSTQCSEYLRSKCIYIYLCLSLIGGRYYKEKFGPARYFVLMLWSASFGVMLVTGALTQENW